MDFKEYLPMMANRVNQFMQAYLEGLDNDALKLKEAMSYGLLLGGKRARPFLVYATGQLFNAKLKNLDYIAAAIECIHAYSLIHDDMPEMDGDLLRRGQPTVHAKFTPTVALLAGDALQTLAFQFATDKKNNLSPSAITAIVSLLARNSGYNGMCGGQAMDLEAEGKHLELDKLRLLHSKKTGALIRTAVLIGALASGKVKLFDRNFRILDSYASYVGLAFQVWDDVLDIIGDTKIMGKSQGADLMLDKSTYPSLMGLEEAKAYALDLSNKAIKELKKLNADTSLLEQFAKFTVNRDH